MLQYLLRLALPAKCALIAALIGAMTGLILTVAGVKASSLLLNRSAELFGVHLADQLAYQAQQPMLRRDRVSLQAVLRSHVDNPLIGYGAIYDTDGETLVEAGERGDGSQSFSADVSLAGEASGGVEISLDGAYLHNEIRLLGWQLVLLSAVLTGLVAALVAVPARRLDTWLEQARELLARPLAESDPPPYPASDSAGRLLAAIHHPPLPVLDDDEQVVEWVVLHVNWQAYGRLSQQWGKAGLDQQLADSYVQADAVAHLYHGELLTYRHDGCTLRLRNIPGTDEPLFRALCCACLLRALGEPLGARPVIGLLRQHGNRWQLQAAESLLVQALHETGGDATIARLQLPGEHRERLGEWADLEDSAIAAVHPPYDRLLERQLERLQQSIRRLT